MKAATDLTQERLTVVEISGSDRSSYRHGGELEATQHTRVGRRGLGLALTRQIKGIADRAYVSMICMETPS
jgi:hypothetical protein